MSKVELVKACASGMAQKCKNEMTSNDKQWNFGNGLQTINTLPETWIKLYRTYPVKSRTRMFDLTSTYNGLLKEGFVNA